MTYFGEFCHLNSSCIGKSITLMFMSSSRNKFALLYQNSVTDILLVSIHHVGAHPGGHQHAVSIQISIIWVKHFFGYLVYRIFFWHKSWWGSLYIYLLSFPRFWTLSIERFWFWFWSILNGVTLKTCNTGIINNESDLEWRRIYCALEIKQNCYWLQHVQS